eukprot:2197831-Rhodomonas_salina.1
MCVCERESKGKGKGRRRSGSETWAEEANPAANDACDGVPASLRGDQRAQVRRQVEERPWHGLRGPRAECEQRGAG